MTSGAAGLAQIRYENATALFHAFIRATVKNPEASPLRGLDGLFAEKLLIQPSYWSQIKSRSRQIGDRLARQFEQRCGRPPGWLDAPHDDARATLLPTADGPSDDDERFIVGLVLSYYRREPSRARARLLELIGEALRPQHEPTSDGASIAPSDDERLWSKTRSAVAPLKLGRKR